MQLRVFLSGYHLSSLSLTLLCSSLSLLDFISYPLLSLLYHLISIYLSDIHFDPMYEEANMVETGLPACTPRTRSLAKSFDFDANSPLAGYVRALGLAGSRVLSYYYSYCKLTLRSPLLRY